MLEAFFSLPEISSNLLIFLDPQATTEVLSIAGGIILREYELYHTHGLSSLNACQARIIPGTTIRLGSSDDTSHISNILSHPDHNTQNIFSLF
jgi:hypothetical protein